MRNPSFKQNVFSESLGINVEISKSLKTFSVTNIEVILQKNVQLLSIWPYHIKLVDNVVIIGFNNVFPKYGSDDTFNTSSV